MQEDRTRLINVNAHEQWSYATSRTPAVAKLKGIRLVCRLCHGCEHFGRTMQLIRQGTLTLKIIDEVIRHYCKTNAVRIDDFRRDLERAVALWKERSERGDWTIDYGPYDALVAEKHAWTQRKPARLRLNPAVDSESPERLPYVKRGRKPMFGRAMTKAELKARYRYFKRRGNVGVC